MTRANDFWSRRKAAVEAETDRQSSLQAEEDTALRRRELEEQDDAEVLQRLNLPDPDTLAADDDLSAFLNDLVPDRLRRRALRRFWRLNPVLANVDGLVDYGEDYTDAATVIDNLQTAYQVGKGMLGHVEALAADTNDDDKPDESATPEMEAEPIALADVAATEPETASAVEAGDEAVLYEDPEEAAPLSRPQRMRFRFSQDETHERTT